MYSYVIEVADSESDFGLHSTVLVSEMLVFEGKTHATAFDMRICKTSAGARIFDQCVHNHDVQVDLMHFSESGKMLITKREQYCATKIRFGSATSIT